MTRQTSYDAYVKICDSGKLGKARLLAYVRLYHHGPMTAGELFMNCQKHLDGHRLVKGSTCARLVELRTQGLARETGETRVCGLTGHNAMMWDVTAKDTPDPLLPKVDKKAALRRVLEEIEAIARKDFFGQNIITLSRTGRDLLRKL